MCGISARGNIRYNMTVANAFNAIIPFPTIRSNGRALLHIVRNKILKAFSRYIWNHRHSYPTWTWASHLSCNDNNDFSIGAAAPDFFSYTANIGLINFYGTSEKTTTRTYHCPTQFVHPGPRSIIAAKTEDTFQSKCAHPIFLTGDKPYGKEPNPKRFVCFMKQCPGGNRCLALTFSAQKKSSSHDRRIFFKKSTRRASKTLRPPEFRNIVKAGLFSAKPFIKFLERSRIVTATDRIIVLFNGCILHLAYG